MTEARSIWRGGHRTRVTTPDGVGIEVREWGDPKGPEVLLVPGVAQSYLSFVRQFSDPDLQRFRIVAYDPRGHGLSDKPFEVPCYTEGKRWSDEVQAVIDGLALRRPVLGGWSMGGRIARQYLVDYGDSRLSGIALISCRPIEDPSVLGGGNDVVRSLDMSDEASRIEVAIAFLRNCFHRQPSAGDFEIMLGYNMLTPFEVRSAIGRWWTGLETSRAALEAVTRPAAIFHGLEDVLVLPKAAELAAACVPHARVSLYEGCGHSVFFEDAPRFNRELAAFVDEVWKAPQAGARTG